MGHIQGCSYYEVSQHFLVDLIGFWGCTAVVGVVFHGFLREALKAVHIPYWY